MTNSSEDAAYNRMLAHCYSVIYRSNPFAWGTAPNSDLLARIPEPLGRVLDLGCGYGKNFPHLLACGACVVGVDICLDALRLARERFRGEIARGQLSLLQGDESVVDGHFDLVVCSGVLVDHVMSRRLQLATRLKSLVIDGGMIFLTVFGTLDPAYGRGERIEPGTYLHDFGFPVHYFQPGELQSLFGDLHPEHAYTRVKHDSFPMVHAHETHVFIGRKGIAQPYGSASELPSAVGLPGEVVAAAAEVSSAQGAGALVADRT